jgi:hypothetical protein
MQVSEARSLAAYQWHRGFAAADRFMMPRDQPLFEALVREGRVWCAANAVDGDFLGLGYSLVEDAEYEIGGVMVDQSVRAVRVAHGLTLITITDVLARDRPFSRGIPLKAHVHVDNRGAQAAAESLLHFRRVGEVRKGGKDGYRYELTIPRSLEIIRDWCRALDRNGTGVEAQVIFPPGQGFASWAEAVELEMAAALQQQQPGQALAG